MIPRYVVNPVKTTQYIQFMTDHALIGKFMGIWPSKKDLLWWINKNWKLTGHMELRLNYKGFFTIVCNNVEDQGIIFEGGAISLIRLAFTFDTGRKKKKNFVKNKTFMATPV